MLSPVKKTTDDYLLELNSRIKAITPMLHKTGQTFNQNDPTVFQMLLSLETCVFYGSVNDSHNKEFGFWTILQLAKQYHPSIFEPKLNRILSENSTRTPFAKSRSFLRMCLNDKTLDTTLLALMNVLKTVRVNHLLCAEALLRQESSSLKLVRLIKCM